jgi:hypothetical protein
MAAPLQPGPHGVRAGQAYPLFVGDRSASGGSAARMPRSVEMPAAVTDLSRLLAHDATLCAQRPRTALEQDRAGDAELARVARAWPELPESVRAAVLAFVDRP